MGAGLVLRTLARVVFVRTRVGFWGVLPAVVEGQCRVAAAYVSSGSMLANFFITISHCAWRHFISISVGLGRRRVVAAYVSAGSMLANFFITISHCPWRDFISLSNGDKETKQRKRLSTICIKCPQRADHCFWFPRRTVLAKPRTLETLLLANPDIPTLRHQCSRARSNAQNACGSCRACCSPGSPVLRFSGSPVLPALLHSRTPALPHSRSPTLQLSNSPAFQLSSFPAFQLSSSCDSYSSRSVLFVEICAMRGLASVGWSDVSWVSGASVGERMVVQCGFEEIGTCPRALVAKRGDVGIREKEGFNAAWFLRAPFYVGTKSSGLHAGDT